MAICIVCKQKVTPKTGIQCQGTCSAWVHYGCLDYVTDDGRKMVHEPYSNGNIYSDVCVVTQMSDKDKINKWNKNYGSLSDQYVKMNETASQVTQETATKSVCQGASIYKSLSLEMCSWADTAFFGYSPRPLEYTPCGNVPHILLPAPIPIQYFPTANQNGGNPNKAINARHGFIGMKSRERKQGQKLSRTSTATETDDYNIVPLDSHKRNFPAVSYVKPNSNSKLNIHDLHYLHTSQHPYGSYHSRIPLYHFNSPTQRPTLRHASTEVSDFQYFNPYNYSDYLNSNQRKSHLKDSKSITTVGATERYENMYARKLVSSEEMNLLSLCDSFNNTHLNSADLATLKTIKYNITGMHKWMSSVKQNSMKESNTLFKNNSATLAADCRELIGPCQCSGLPDIFEQQKSTVTAKIKVSIKKSKSTPLHASLQTRVPAEHLRINKSVAVFTDKMVENVPFDAECQTSKIQTFSEVRNYAVISTNTSIENSVKLLLSKSVGSSNSKCCSPDSKKSNMVKLEKDISISLSNSDAPSCTDAKSKVVKNDKFKNVSVENSVTNLDASVCPGVKREKLLIKKSESGHIYSWTKLDASELPDEISKQQMNKIFGKLLTANRNINQEETDDPSSESVLTSCMKNVLSTFEMLSSQICDIFYNRKKKHVVNYCSAVRSEGDIGIVRKNITSSNFFEKNHECLTVKLLTFRND